MIFKFPVIVNKASAISLGESLEIGYLNKNLRMILSDSERNKISAEGLELFLKKTIKSLLKEDDNKKIHIKPKKNIDHAFNIFLETKEILIERSIHDLKIEIEVEFEPTKRRCNFFGNNIHHYGNISVILQVAAGTVLTIGSLQLTQQGIISMSRDTNTGISIAQAILAGISNLIISFTSPDLLFISNFGAAIDYACRGFFKKLCNKCNDGNIYLEEESPKIIMDNCKKIKIYSCKFLLLIAILDNIWSSSTMQYNELMLLGGSIEYSETLMSTQFVMISTWFSFIINQLSEPILMFSMLMFGFKLIDYIFCDEMQVSEEFKEIKYSDIINDGEINDFNSFQSDNSILEKSASLS